MPRDVATPDCPKCGCNATELVGAGMRWGRPWARFECDHCGTEFPLGDRPSGSAEPYCVEYAEQRCPFCRSPRTHVTGSPAVEHGVKKRSHKCDACGKNFATRQVIDQPDKPNRAARNGHAH